MDWTGSFQFRVPTRVVFGLNCVQGIGETAKGMGSKAPMVLTDPVVHKVGLTEGVEKSLKDAGLRVEVCAEVTTEPTLAAIEKAVAFYRERGCDLIVAVGGGSTMDSSKSISLLLGNEGKLSEYHQMRVGADWRPPKPIQRRGTEIISVPTTAGTGSEVDGGSGVFDPEAGIKKWAGSPLLAPTVCFYDPLLTVSMPPRVTADTGMDAFSQVTEAYLRTASKPISDTLGLKTIEIIGQYLPKAWANGKDIQARSAVMTASAMMGMAFPNGGLIHVHTFAEVLGDYTHLPHGRLIGLMLPHVLEFSLVGCAEKMVDIGRALGEKVDGIPAREGAEKALAAIKRLCAEVEINEPLRTHNVSEETLGKVAEVVYAQHENRSATSPRGFRNLDEVMGILKKAY